MICDLAIPTAAVVCGVRASARACHKLCPCECRSCRVWQRRCTSDAARAFALRRRRRGACNGCWIIFGCILTTYYATMHRFASALHPTLFRTPPPPHVASWQSWLRLFDIAFYDGRRLCFRGSSCQPRRRSIISTRGRLHLLKAAKARLGQFRILKPDTKNESTTNTRLTTHYSPSASRPPWPSAAS